MKTNVFFKAVVMVVAEVAEQMTVFITIDRFSYQLLTVHLIILHIIGGITCICINGDPIHSFGYVRYSSYGFECI